MNQTDVDCRAAADFQRDGFAVVRGFLAPPEVDEVVQRVERYIREILPTAPENDAFYADKSKPETLFRIGQMHAHDPYFHGMLHSERSLSLAGRMLDDEPVSRDLQLFGKAPGIGNQSPPHQDGYYFMLKPNEGLTFWLALDPVDEDNGCMRYVPGSHRRGMREHGKSEVFGFSRGILDFGPEDLQSETAVAAEPGDMIAHHGLTIHRADGNPSARRRWAITRVYYAKRARPDAAGREAYENKLHEQWKEADKL